MSELMKRPSMADNYVQQRAAELYMPKIREWYADDRFDEKSTAKDLMKAVRPNREGGEMVRDLERRHYWAVDDDLEEVLEDCASFCEVAIDELTRQWVACLGIRPEYAVGDRVRMSVTLEGRKEGIVVKVMDDLARYGVRIEGRPESQHWVVESEKVLGLVKAEVAA